MIIHIQLNMITKRKKTLALVGTVLLSIGASGILWGQMRTTTQPPIARSISVSLVPEAIAIDQHTHRAFISIAGCLEGHGGSVSVVDTRKGTLLRTTMWGVCPGAIAIDERTSRAFVIDAGLNATGRTIGVFDTQSGALLRTVQVNNAPAAVAVDEQDGRVFVTYQSSHTITILDARTGHVLRSNTIGISPTTIAVDGKARRVFVTAPLGRTIAVLSATTGRIVRRVATSPGLLSPPLIDVQLGRVFVTNQAIDRHGNPVGSSKVYVLNARSGAILGSLKLGLGASPVAVDRRTGCIIVLMPPLAASASQGPSGSAISLLDRTTKRVIRTTPIGPDVEAVAVDKQRDRILITTSSGVTALDMSTGTILRTIPTAGVTGPIAVDEQTGYAFVIGESVPTRWFNRGVVGWLRNLFRDPHVIDQQALPTGAVSIITPRAIR